jgi:hypothetical protein
MHDQTNKRTTGKIMQEYFFMRICAQGKTGLIIKLSDKLKSGNKTGGLSTPAGLKNLHTSVHT